MKEKKVSHRKPPKPLSWNCARGICRFCGENIVENGKTNTRKHWHQKCANTWNIMNDPKEARKVVGKRDKYQCVVCSKDVRHERYDVDHIKPLFEANGDPTYWQLPNLRTLCVDCHKDKTREDMVRFHEAKRIAQKSKTVALFEEIQSGHHECENQ